MHFKSIVFHYYTKKKHEYITEAKPYFSLLALTLVPFSKEKLFNHLQWLAPSTNTVDILMKVHLLPTKIHFLHSLKNISLSFKVITINWPGIIQSFGWEQMKFYIHNLNSWAKTEIHKCTLTTSTFVLPFSTYIFRHTIQSIGFLYTLRFFPANFSILQFSTQTQMQFRFRKIPFFVDAGCQHKHKVNLKRNRRAMI